MEEGADFIVGETFGDVGEAMIALEAIKKYGQGLKNFTLFSGLKGRVQHLKLPDYQMNNDLKLTRCKFGTPTIILRNDFV